MIRERIYQKLSENVNLAAAINEVRPLVLEETDELPSLTYQIEIQHDNDYDGVSNFKKAILETNVYSSNLQEAKTVNALLKTAAATISGVETGLTVFNIFPSREIENFDSDEREFQINTQFTISYRED